MEQKLKQYYFMNGETEPHYSEKQFIEMNGKVGAKYERLLQFENISI